MDRREECICCQEIKEVLNTNLNAVFEGDISETPTCITQHPGFLAVCTNKWVLVQPGFNINNNTKIAMRDQNISS